MKNRKLNIKKSKKKNMFKLDLQGGKHTMITHNSKINKRFLKKSKRRNNSKKKSRKLQKSSKLHIKQRAGSGIIKPFRALRNKALITKDDPEDFFKKHKGHYVKKDDIFYVLLDYYKDKFYVFIDKGNNNFSWFTINNDYISYIIKNIYKNETDDTALKLYTGNDTNDFYIETEDDKTNRIERYNTYYNKYKKYLDSYKDKLSETKEIIENEPEKFFENNKGHYVEIDDIFYVLLDFYKDTFYFFIDKGNNNFSWFKINFDNIKGIKGIKHIIKNIYKNETDDTPLELYTDDNTNDFYIESDDDKTNRIERYNTYYNKYKKYLDSYKDKLSETKEIIENEPEKFFENNKGHYVEIDDIFYVLLDFYKDTFYFFIDKGNNNFSWLKINFDDIEGIEDIIEHIYKNETDDTALKFYTGDNIESDDDKTNRIERYNTYYNKYKKYLDSYKDKLSDRINNINNPETFIKNNLGKAFINSEKYKLLTSYDTSGNDFKLYTIDNNIIDINNIKNYSEEEYKGKSYYTWNKNIDFLVDKLEFDENTLPIIKYDDLLKNAYIKLNKHYIENYNNKDKYDELIKSLTELYINLPSSDTEIDLDQCNCIDKCKIYLQIMANKIDENPEELNIEAKKYFTDIIVKAEQTEPNFIINYRDAYNKSPWKYSNDIKIQYTLIDFTVRANNNNICIPHALELNIPKKNEDLSDWYVEDFRTKIPSYKKLYDPKFNTRSKIRYAIERCLFPKKTNSDNKDDNLSVYNPDEIRGIFIPLDVEIREDGEIQENKTNHANMIYIEKNTVDENTVDENTFDENTFDENTVDKNKTHLTLHLFDPNTKPVDYIKGRLEDVVESINNAKPDEYIIDEVNVLNLNLPFEYDAGEGQRWTETKEKIETRNKDIAIHNLLPNGWIDAGICGSVTWFIFILWSIVCEVENISFKSMYKDICYPLYLCKSKFFCDKSNQLLLKYIMEKEDSNVACEETLNIWGKNKLKKDDEEKNKIRKSLKQIYVSFLYLIMKFLEWGTNQNKDEKNITLYKYKTIIRALEMLKYQKEHNTEIKPDSIESGGRRKKSNRRKLRTSRKRTLKSKRRRKSKKR